VSYEETVQESAQSSRSVRRAAIVGLAVGIPASALFLWLAFRGASPDEVWTAAQAADPWLVALAVVFIAAVYLAQAARWRVIAASGRPGELGFMEMVLGAVACNNVLPGRLGELFRARWLAVAAPMPSGRALATVGLDRGSDAVVLFGFLVISLPFVTSAAWVTGIVLGGAVLIAGLLLLLGAARAYARRRRRERRERGRLRRIARDVVDALAEPLGRRRIAWAIGLSVLAWGAFAVAVWLVARSLGIRLDPTECVFVTGVLNLGVAIPSSPGFVGTYQWLAVSALAVFDVAREEALAFSILLHASWYVPTTLIGGALVLFRLDWGIRNRS
jgi:hypothetical protein